jgi:hypothetical protein
MRRSDQQDIDLQRAEDGRVQNPNGEFLHAACC